ALLVTEDGDVVARGYQEFAQHFPRPGWVEHEPEEIWVAVQSARPKPLPAGEQAGVAAPTAIGITNQRETVVLWDRETLRAPRRAIVWQDRRTAALCQRPQIGRAQLWTSGH